MSTRTNQKYKKIYNDINVLYNKELLSLPQACAKYGISKSTYYKACEMLKKKSAPEKNRIVEEKKKIKKIQKGGNIDSVLIPSKPELPQITDINKNILSVNNINNEQSYDNEQIERRINNAIRDADISIEGYAKRINSKKTR